MILIKSFLKPLKNILFIIGLLLLLFVHWIDIKFTLLILFFFSILNFFQFKNNTHNKEKLIYVFAIIFSLILVLYVKLFIWHEFIFNFDIVKYGPLDISNLSKNNSRLLIVFLNPMIVIISLLNFKKLALKNINTLTLIFFLISSLTIIIEFVLYNNFQFSNSIIPTFKDVTGYRESFLGIYRPFGLTGSFSSNGGILLLSLILVNELNLLNYFYLIVFFIATVMTLSCQALVVNLTFIIYLFFKSQIFRDNNFLKIILSLFSLIIVFILLSPIYQQKFELSYLNYIFKNNFLDLQNLLNLSLKDFLFGLWGTPFYMKESFFFHVYKSVEFGLIFSIIHYLPLFFFLRRTKNLFFNIFIIIFSCLHYSTLIFFEPWLILILIYFSSFKNHDSIKFINEKNYFPKT